MVWESDEQWAWCRSVTFLSFKELLSWMIRNDKSLELFSFVAWAVWHQRNQVRLHQRSCSTHLITAETKVKLDEFLSVQPAPRSSPPRPQGRWRPPPSDLVKVNFDVAIFSNDRKSGIGAVVRDSQWSVLASMSRKVPRLLSPLEKEVKATAVALPFATDLGFAKVI